MLLMLLVFLLQSRV